MTHYRDIYEIAADNYGIVTSAQAKEAGISDKEMCAISKRGRIYRIGHGVYRLTDYIPTPYDPYADAVALCGQDAYLYGESVLAMLELVPTNPTRLFVASPHRVRKKLPSSIRLARIRQGDEPVIYEGIRSQSVSAAIRACKGVVMPGRLLQAADEARRKGILGRAEHAALLEELKSW